MSNDRMMEQISRKEGFLAALDQSGGSTPGALRQYGVPDSAYSGDAEMFQRMHEMRVRVMTAPAFDGDKVIAAILFENTMDGQVAGKPVPAYLWDERGVVPFLKVDQGLEAEKDGVRLMKPIPLLDQLLRRAGRTPQGRPRPGPLGRLRAPGRLRTPLPQSRHDRQLFSSAPRGSAPIDERRGVRRRPGGGDRSDLPGLHGEDPRRLASAISVASRAQRRQLGLVFALA